MYLHIGSETIVSAESVIGIFDLDQGAYGPRGRAYLRRAEEEGVVVDLSDRLPRSFVVCDHPYHRQIVYLTQLSTKALSRRWKEK